MLLPLSEHPVQARWRAPVVLRLPHLTAQMVLLPVEVAVLRKQAQHPAQVLVAK